MHSPSFRQVAEIMVWKDCASSQYTEINFPKDIRVFAHSDTHNLISW